MILLATMTPQNAPNPWALAARLVPFFIWMFILWRRKNRAAAAAPDSPGLAPAQGLPAAAGGEAAFRAKLETAFRENGSPLNAALTPDGKKKAMETWRGALKQHVPDYVALMAGHPAAEQVMQIEVDHYMRAYLCGALARERKIAEVDALQVGFLLGRELRDSLRARRIPIDTLSANLGVGLDQSFAAVVQAGWGKS
jgi:hypothetical protein